jgi:GH24 family phage-related lysozyme (muramidase)
MKSGEESLHHSEARTTITPSLSTSCITTSSASTRCCAARQRWPRALQRSSGNCPILVTVFEEWEAQQLARLDWPSAALAAPKLSSRKIPVSYPCCLRNGRTISTAFNPGDSNGKRPKRDDQTTHQARGKRRFSRTACRSFLWWQNDGGQVCRGSAGRIQTERQREEAVKWKHASNGGVFR